MCDHCNDTGSLSKDIGGYLDCTHCHTASEREHLDNWIREQRHEGVMEHVGRIDAWLIYQRGKAAAAGHSQ